MLLWIIVLWTVLALLGLALAYLGTQSLDFFPTEIVAGWSKGLRFIVGMGCVIGFMGLITLCLDFVNAIICTLYLAMIWVVTDGLFWIIQKFFQIHFPPYCVGCIALITTFLVLSVGWYLDHHVWQTNYTLTTTKDVPPLKIALIADVHMGTTFSTDGFQKHMNAIQKQNPDIVVVVGDFVDDSTTKEEMMAATKTLGQLSTKYGVYFVFGNHDKGYYGAKRRGFSAKDLVDELNKNGVVVLRDKSQLIADSFYVVGRRDLSEVKELKGQRLSMDKWIKNLDTKKYMIVLDHQPADYKNQEKAGVDLVLSGHTHGGQLFPLNQIGKWIGANDLVYGHEKRGKTDFIVTSGLSNWALRFKTGTKSEFVIINIQKGAKNES